MIFLAPAYKKLRKKYKEKCDIIEKKLDELHELEIEGCASMDKAAEPFARLMEEVLAYGPLCVGGKKGDALKWLGYNLGKWIYIMDAYNDIEDDAKKKAYNPLLRQFAYGGENIGGFKDRIKERVGFNLTYSLSQAAKACELLDMGSGKEIVENIIYMGCLGETEKILGTGSCIRVEESV